MPLISILVALIVVCLLWWALTKILAAFGIGEPINTIARVVFVVVVVIWLVSFIGGPSLRLT